MRCLRMVATLMALFACHDLPPGTGDIEAEHFALQEMPDITLTEGERLLVKLVVLNTGNRPVTFSAENLPAFASLSGDTLTLAPEARSEGETVVTVHASSGDTRDSKQFTLRVVRPGTGGPHKPPEPCNTPMEPVVNWPVPGGRAWKRIPSNTCEELYGVWGSSASDVWAVGAKGTIIRWNGSTWTPVASGTDRDLMDVRGTGPNDVWAVGGRTGDALPTILHWDGVRWSHSPWSKDAVDDGPPCCSTRATPRVLLSVLPFSQTKVWAVGHGSPAAWDGNQWRGYGYYHSTPKNHIGGLGFMDWWEVGPNGYVWHGIGTGMSNESVDRYVDLYGLWAFTPEDVWAVGERLSYVNGNPIRNGAIAHRSNGTWVIENKADWPLFRSIWGSAPQDMWALGPSGIAYRDGTAWTPRNEPGLTGNEVWGTGQLDAWIVGPGGRVLHLGPQ